MVICPFIDLSGKRLLLENIHNKNGLSKKGRPSDREETLHKELETVQTARKKVVPESHKIKASAAPGLFYFPFVCRDEPGIEHFRVRFLLMLS
jgi:hypothetical protein